MVGCSDGLPAQLDTLLPNPLAGIEALIARRRLARVLLRLGSRQCTGILRLHVQRAGAQAKLARRQAGLALDVRPLDTAAGRLAKGTGAQTSRES